jgi:hypothetical protein
MIKMQLKSRLRFALMVLLFFSLVPTCVKAATFNFNTLYKGSGTKYTTQTNKIDTINKITGTSFQFYQNGSVFTGTYGNNVSGVLTYYDNNHVLQTINGSISRQQPATNITSFFFTANAGDNNSSIADGYLLIVPGKESFYSNGISVSTSSNFTPASLNDVVNSVPNITTVGTLNSFSTCIGIPSSTQTLTVSGSSLTTPISITVPLGYEVSSTSPSGGFSSTLT